MFICFFFNFTLDIRKLMILKLIIFILKLNCGQYATLYVQQRISLFSELGEFFPSNLLREWL